MRFPLIQRELDAAEPGFALILGDSHAEFLCGHPLGPRPVVNGGVGGIGIGGYAARLAELRAPSQAGVAVMILGSNDLSVRVRPLSPEGISRFEAAALSLMRWLRTHADRVVVLALPPMDPMPGQEREAGAVAEYSARLERLASETGCGFADPFSDLREGRSGFARPGALSDGVHLADYGAAARKVASLLG